MPPTRAFSPDGPDSAPSVDTDTGTDTVDGGDPARTRRGFLSSLASAAAGVAGAAALARRGAAADGTPRYVVPDRRMRHAFDDEVNVIVGDDPVDAVRRTAHADAEYVDVVPGATFTRSQYEEFLSLLRLVVSDRTLTLVGDGFVVTSPTTSRASWVMRGTLPDGTRACLPATGTHRWAPNGKCIRAEVDWLSPDATQAFVASLAERVSYPDSLLP